VGYLGLEVLIDGDREGQNMGTFLDRLEKRGSEYRIQFIVFYTGKEDEILGRDRVQRTWVSVKGVVSREDWVGLWM